MNRLNLEPSSLKPLLIGGMMFALIALVIDVKGTTTSPRTVSHREENCQGQVNAAAVISREQLAQFLTIPERNSKDKVRQVLKEPYCQLANLQIRAGVAADREVYPLAFDDRTRLVVLYEGNEYAGYRLSD